MRSIPVAALVLSAAGLAALHAAAGPPGGALPVWALFSFAVSAFREPLR